MFSTNASVLRTGIACLCWLHVFGTGRKSSCVGYKQECLKRDGYHPEVSTSMLYVRYAWSSGPVSIGLV